VKTDLIAAYMTEEECTGLENALLKWKADLTGDGYPVQRKEHALQMHDPRFTRVQGAQENFNVYLSKLTQRCIHNRIKFWKVRKPRQA
jgi:hypothetical protein